MYMLAYLTNTLSYICRCSEAQGRSKYRRVGTSRYVTYQSQHLRMFRVLIINNYLLPADA